jgi:hypothetical protein
MEELRVRHEAVALELHLLKDLYINYLPGSERSEGEDPLQGVLFRHVVLQTINSQKKF